MRVLLTGATGFAGRHLLELLLAQGHTVWALVRQVSGVLPSTVTQMVGDLLDADGVKTAVSHANPQIIYHLAGQASPSQSWKIPVHTLQVNTLGTINLLEAVLANYEKPNYPSVIAVTSADMYGLITQRDLPINEQTSPEPRHPYGVSKLAVAHLVRLYAERYGLRVIEGRPFNHIGPHQSLGFVLPDFASQIAAIKLGQQPNKMMVGNLDAQRDFTDVRDVVLAYTMLAEAGQAGESYLICSGQPVPVHYLLTTLRDVAGVHVDVEYDPQRMRPSDVPCLYGSYYKILSHTGWKPQHHIRQTIAEVFDEWLLKLNE